MALRVFAAVGSAAVLLTLAVACGEQGTGREPSGQAMPEKTIREVLEEQTDSLMSVPGVVGIAQGECAAQPCIKVFVGKKTPELLQEIPSTIDGYLVDVQETGEIRALDAAMRRS